MPIGQLLNSEPSPPSSQSPSDAQVQPSVHVVRGPQSEQSSPAMEPHDHPVDAIAIKEMRHNAHAAAGAVVGRRADGERIRMENAF